MREETGAIEEALHVFVGATDEQMDDSLNFLRRSSRSRLEAWLRPFAKRPADVEDLSQEVWFRVCRSRKSFKPESEISWWAYLKRIAIRCGIDHIRKELPLVPLEDLDRIPNDDFRILESFVDMLGDAQRLYELADEVWLGPQPADQTRRLLAAKLFYVDSLPWQRVCEVLNGGYSHRPPLTREMLDSWLIDHVVVRQLAFESLYYSNFRLSEMLLGIAPGDSSKVDDVVSQAVASGASEWTADEARAILWRYRYGILLDHIASRSDCPLEKSELLAIFVRCGAKFPFQEIMESLNTKFERSPATRGVTSKQGIWRRLVFQYFAADELPQKDIYDRVHPSAQVAGFKLTEGNLNVWLSNGRIFKQLAKHHVFQEAAFQGDEA